MDAQPFVNWFRQAGPYINAHRGKTFVILFSGEAVEDERFPRLIHDLSLLYSLGIRLVLVHGARPQIEQRLHEAGQELRYVRGLRITDSEALTKVKQAVGRVRIRIEARLSMGLPNSPMHGARIRVVSGNFVTARPLGVREGIDYCFTGEVRRINCPAGTVILHRRPRWGALHGDNPRLLMAGFVQNPQVCRNPGGKPLYPPADSVLYPPRQLACGRRQGVPSR
jgi:amino-acid N-acetyltransferase